MPAIPTRTMALLLNAENFSRTDRLRISRPLDGHLVLSPKPPSFREHRLRRSRRLPCRQLPPSANEPFYFPNPTLHLPLRKELSFPSSVAHPAADPLPKEQFPGQSTRHAIPSAPSAASGHLYKKISTAFRFFSLSYDWTNLRNLPYASSQAD
jgi:hypothetical protein